MRRCPGFRPTGIRCTLATAALLSTTPRVYHGAESRHLNFYGLSDNLRLGAKLIMQLTLDAEFTEFLGRDRYARGERAREGYRNGHAPFTVRSTAGAITLERQKARGTEVPFTSRLLGAGVTRTNALESLVIAGFVRGLSVRDIEAALAEALGPEMRISKSTVAVICQAIKDEFDAWRRRSLGDIELEYLFLDASMFKMHRGARGARGEPVLAAWGITSDGKPCFIGLDAMSDEGTDPWSVFLADLKHRSLRGPLLGISDGAPGLIAAFEAEFSKSLRQRCLIHRCRNLLAKVPRHAKDDVKRAFWAIFDDIDEEVGERAVAECNRRARAFEARYRKIYPGAVRCLMDDFESLTTHLRFPREHWRRIRHSNFIERTFGESRRRVKVIGRFPGEESCLSLVWAVLDRASRGWRGVQMTPAAIRLLAEIRRELFTKKRKEVKRKVVARAA